MSVQPSTLLWGCAARDLALKLLEEVKDLIPLCVHEPPAPLGRIEAAGPRGGGAPRAPGAAGEAKAAPTPQGLGSPCASSWLGGWKGDTPLPPGGPGGGERHGEHQCRCSMVGPRGAPRKQDADGPGPAPDLERPRQPGKGRAPRRPPSIKARPGAARAGLRGGVARLEAPGEAEEGAHRRGRRAPSALGPEQRAPLA